MIGFDINKSDFSYLNILSEYDESEIRKAYCMELRYEPIRVDSEKIKTVYLEVTVIWWM